MLETLGYPGLSEISAKIETITHTKESYSVSGKLMIHGIEKPFSYSATLVQGEKSFRLNGNFMIQLSEFNIEPPDLLFMRVKNDVRIEYSFEFSI